MPVYCSCTCWTFGNSWKGPMKYGLPVLPSWCLSDLGIESLDFSEFWHGARNSYEVVCDKNWRNGPKIGFFEFKEKIVY